MVRFALKNVFAYLNLVLCFLLKKRQNQIGGQAVIEGVMMKAQEGWSVAVRDPWGDIKTKKEALQKPKPLWRLPLLRGFVVLCQTLRLGLKALEFSASVVGGEEEKPMSKTSIALTMVFAFLIAIGLFLFLPVYLTKVIGTFLKPVGEGQFLFNAVDGIIRIGLFLIYIIAVGMWKDMRRIFEYHGAEHKVIHAYEHGERLVPEEIKKFSSSHPRCGTSFLMTVMIISILLFSFIPKDYNLLEKFVARLVLIPAVAGFSYETLKLSARYHRNIFMKTFAMPGIALQKLTTKEPDENQIEVAIVALKEALSFTHNPDRI